MITNNKRYSLLETDSSGNLLTELNPEETILEYIEPKPIALSWWQKIIAYFKQLWKDM